MTIYVQIKRNIAANWTSANPVLLDGQQGYETDTGRIKIGDGTTAWTSLLYRFESGGGGGGVTDGDKGDIVVSSGGTVWGIDYTAVNAVIAPTWTNVSDKPAAVSSLSGTNTGDQTTIAGITGTKAQFDTAVTDGNFLYVGDAPTSHTHVIANVTGLQTALDGKQATLVSATNIKTLNGSSILGSGNIVIEGGEGGAAAWGGITGTLSAQTDLQSALDGKSGTGHTHSDATTSAAGFLSASDKTKLNGIATAATANATDAALRDRATHTGAQAISTVTGLQTDLDGKAATSHTHTAAAITDFSSAVAATASVTANTAKVSNANHSGDATGDTALTLATVNVNVGSFGSATQVATFTTNAKGLTTAAGNTSISVPATAINDSTTAGRAMVTAADSAAQTALLDAATSSLKGLAPASGGGTTNFLRADLTWAAPAGGGGSGFPHATLGHFQKPAVGSFVWANPAGVFGAVADDQSANRIFYSPWVAPFSFTADQIGVNVNANAGGTARVGFYAAAAAGAIGAKLWESANNLNTSTTGVVLETESVSFVGGLVYYTAIATLTNVRLMGTATSRVERPTIRLSGGGEFNFTHGYFAAHTYADAMPATPTGLSNTGNKMPVPVMRIGA